MSAKDIRPFKICEESENSVLKTDAFYRAILVPKHLIKRPPLFSFVYADRAGRAGKFEVAGYIDSDVLAIKTDIVYDFKESESRSRKN